MLAGSMVQAAGLPQLNLTVSWRLEAGEAHTQRQQAVAGQVILDSRGTIVGRTGVGGTVVETDRQGSSVQSVQVLNGHQARLFFGQQVGRTTWQMVWLPNTTGGTQGSASATTSSSTTSSSNSTTSAQPQVGLQSQTSWVDLGDGLVVRPRWPGGRLAVLLDIEARSQRARSATPVGPGFDPDGQVARAEVATTLSLPLGQWVAIARQGGSASNDRPTTLSTRSLDDGQTQVLWVRVSTSGALDAPPPLP